jgi:hypothetical protein
MQTIVSGSHENDYKESPLHSEHDILISALEINLIFNDSDNGMQ